MFINKSVDFFSIHNLRSREIGWKSKAKLLKKETALASVRRAAIGVDSGGGQSALVIGPTPTQRRRAHFIFRHEQIDFFKLKQFSYSSCCASIPIVCFCSAICFVCGRVRQSTAG